MGSFVVVRTLFATMASMKKLEDIVLYLGAVLFCIGLIGLSVAAAIAGLTSNGVTTAGVVAIIAAIVGAWGFLLAMLAAR